MLFSYVHATFTEISLGNLSGLSVFCLSMGVALTCRWLAVVAGNNSAPFATL